MHANSYALFRRHALPYFQPGMQVLEVGPDSPDSQQPSLATLVWEKTRRYNSTDLATMRGEYGIEFIDNAFDLVFAANVIEHVRKPWLWVQELARVLKVGGHLILVSPVSWPYHPAPVDCWRLYPDAYRALFDHAGLETVLALTDTLEAIDAEWVHEHGTGPVIDCIAIGRKPG